MVLSVVIHRKNIIKNSSIWKSILTSRWLSNWFFTISFIWKQQVDIKLFIHVHFKWVENHRHFFTIFKFSSEYTTNFTLDYHSSITQKISHTMMINYSRNPYDKNDSRSWRWWYQKIWHTMMINIHKNDSRSWRWWYHGNRRRFWGKREFIRRHHVLYFIIDRWCVIINEVLEFNLGYYVFGGF